MERPSLGRIILGAVLVLATALMLLSVLSPGATEHAAQNYHGTAGAPENLCGRIGAFVSDNLLLYLGAPAAWLLILLGLTWIALVFANREIHTPALRLTGILLAVFCMSALSQLHSAGGSPWFEAPNVIGTFTADFLATNLSFLGSLALLLTVGAVALFMATDMLLWDLVVYLVGKTPGWVSAGAKAFFGKELAAPVRVGEGAVEKPVRRAKRKPEPSAEDEEASEDEDLDEELYEETVVVEPKRAAVQLPQEPEPEPEPAHKPEPAGAKAEGGKKELPDIEEAATAGSDADYVLPGLDLLDEHTEVDPSRHHHLIQEKARVLERCLGEFGIAVRVVGIDTGPVVTLYELELAPGIKVGRIIGLSDDIAMALKAPNVRIVAPIPGKSTVGVEVPNLDKEFVRLREIIEDRKSVV